ncbi:hypothetical protein Cgig2_000759 [Carnegiea gigantea]|uniref:DUF4283 domain-containing protein n=1 Tax=Carnegiea gigantea TaxID=171969 RepID=A0A9Q1Q5L1_9CARY|nr:hypothetical protein Cgig2_000759 [Carnegiea gigantea]
MLGANPPIQVMDGFFRRLWGNKVFKGAIVKANGVFIVRFHSVLELDEEINKHELAWILVWVSLPELDFKYYSKKGLSKLSHLLGNPLVTYKVTQNNVHTKFDRLLVEMDLNQEFLEEVTFMDEFSTLLVQKVEYAWKLMKCSRWSMFGHLGEACRKKHRKECRKERVPNQNHAQGVIESEE